MRSFSFSPTVDRFVVIVDTQPALTDVPGMIPLRTRKGRSVQAAAFPRLARVAHFLNLLDKQLRKMRRVEETDVRLFSWSYIVIDRVTAAVLTRSSIDAMVTQNSIQRTYTRQNVMGLPVLDSAVTSTAISEYKTFLARLKIVSPLQPTLKYGEDAIETLQFNAVPLGNEPTAQSVLDRTNRTFSIEAPSGGVYKDVYRYPSTYPDAYIDQLYTLFGRVAAAVARVRSKLLNSLQSDLQSREVEHHTTQEAVRLVEKLEFRIKMAVSLDDPTLRNFIFTTLLNEGVSPMTSEEYLDEVVMRAVRALFPNGWRDYPALEVASRLRDEIGPLYIHRPLLNGMDLHKWAGEQGLASTLNPSDMHVTLLFSKEPVMWEKFELDDSQVTVREGARRMDKFGKEGDVLVLHFESSFLEQRNHEFMSLGGSSDFVGYKAHVTISYNAADVDISKILPYQGPLIFGPEIGKALDLDWKPSKKEEKPTATASAVDSDSEIGYNEGSETVKGEGHTFTEEEIRAKAREEFRANARRVINDEKREAEEDHEKAAVVADEPREAAQA